MDLVAIALLCQVVGGYVNHYYSEIQEKQLTCQKYYITCWNKKREEQLQKSVPARVFLDECVLERQP